MTVRLLQSREGAWVWGLFRGRIYFLQWVQLRQLGGVLSPIPELINWGKFCAIGFHRNFFLFCAVLDA
jgi:hypothetical protein